MARARFHTACTPKQSLGPRHGIGRSCKVGKEQIIGLLTALERFAGEDDGARNARFAIVTDALLQSLSPLEGLRVQRVKDAAPDVLFIFVPAGGQATAMMKAIKDLKLREAGITTLVRPAASITAPESMNRLDVPGALASFGPSAPGSAPIVMLALGA